MPRLQNSRAVALEWVTNRTVTFSSIMISRMRLMHLRLKVTSPTDRASSTIRMSGLVATANAKPRRARMPLEYDLMGWSM